VWRVKVTGRKDFVVTVMARQLTAAEG
jgi:hypothetical protein